MVSDSTQQYILPIISQCENCGHLFADGYEKPPLDIPAIEKQLDKVLDELGDYRDVEGYFRAKDRAIDEIKALFGLENKENK